MAPDRQIVQIRQTAAQKPKSLRPLCPTGSALRGPRLTVRLAAPARWPRRYCPFRNLESRLASPQLVHARFRKHALFTSQRKTEAWLAMQKFQRRLSRMKSGRGFLSIFDDLVDRILCVLGAVF